MLNKTLIQGRFVKEPELKQTANGHAVVSFSLAVERDFKDKETGEKVTDFIDCVAWKGLAEFVSKYFCKGKMAVVEGRMQNREWTDKDGNKRKTTEVVASNIYFCESKRDAEQQQTAKLSELPDSSVGCIPWEDMPL